MLLELGLRVYDTRWSVKSLHLTRQSLINFFLKMFVKTQSTVAKILGIESLSPHVSGNPKFEYAGAG